VDTPDRLRGSALGLASALLFGLGAPVSKLLLPGTQPLVLAALLYLGAGLAFLLARPSRAEAPLARSDAPWLAASVIAGAGAAQAEQAPFGHPCKAQNGVRFCPAETLAQRVHSFDGVPLDVDVTLPPSGEGPFPTIVMMHGWGGSKTDFESSAPGGNGNSAYPASSKPLPAATR